MDCYLGLVTEPLYHKQYINTLPNQETKNKKQTDKQTNKKVLAVK